MLSFAKKSAADNHINLLGLTSEVHYSMKKIYMFFVFALFMFNTNIVYATDVADKQFQLRLKARENFCLNTFQNYPGRDFIVIPKKSDTLYVYCMAEFYRSEEDYDTAIEYYKEVIKRDSNFIEAYIELSDLYGIVGDLDFTILYLYKALNKLKLLFKGSCKYLETYVNTYNDYIEAYESKNLEEVATIERKKLLDELEALSETSIKPDKKCLIIKYINEIKYKIYNKQ